ncbi:amidohydrolase [Pigmentiphaga sp. H8]|uniref:amidohydrolase family protein n=1 Tax=unclassified Pigmentiphaga TaxID=2626614 RepID=UPI000F59551D|nr:amidohydrolase family protein [Pigmentiphaga sp. H8]AZG10738.1 amidohydrolase [Pigmentiphaga sp. H8]
MIDVHQHILPARYVQEVGEAYITAQGSSTRLPPWSVEGALQGMDAAGIRTAINSISAPGFAPLAAAPAAALARWCNELAAQIGADHPGRFGFFAALPLPDIDASLREVEHGFDRLGADGVCVLTHHGGHYLGSALYDPLYEELDRRGAVVFVHPTAPASMQLVAGLSPSTLEFPFDTTRAVADIVLAGVLTRYPRIRWIFSHAGGAIPYLAGRVELLTTNKPALRERIPQGFSAELRKLYFDCALSLSPTTLDALVAEVGMDRLLFGSDYPFGPKDQMTTAARGIAALPWSEDRKQQLRSGNAAQLFPRWRA